MHVGRSIAAPDQAVLSTLLLEWRRLRMRGAEMVRIEMDAWCVETLLADAAAGLPGREHVRWRGMDPCFGDVPIEVREDHDHTLRWTARLNGDLLAGEVEWPAQGRAPGAHAVAS